MSVRRSAEEALELAAYRERLVQRSTSEMVAQVLRERITQGGFRPGERLSEESISRALGVSRNSLREGFRLLVRERLVVHRMNRGVFVRVPTAGDIVDLFRLRCILETAALRAATGADLTGLTSAVERGEDAASRGEWEAVATANLHFHRAITALLASERVDELFETAMAELRLSFQTIGSSQQFHAPYLRRNRAILDWLRQGDSEQAARELESYLRDAEQQLIRSSISWSAAGSEPSHDS